MRYSFSFGGLLLVGLIAVGAAPVFAGEVEECLEQCRQQLCADREECQQRFEDRMAELDAEAAKCDQLPAKSKEFRACRKGVADARALAKNDVTRCINLANTAAGACARACSPSPSQPIPIPGPNDPSR
jgi:hypothetical protein